MIASWVERARSVPESTRRAHVGSSESMPPHVPLPVRRCGRVGVGAGGVGGSGWLEGGVRVEVGVKGRGGEGEG